MMIMNKAYERQANETSSPSSHSSSIGSIGFWEGRQADRGTLTETTLSLTLSNGFR